MTLSDYFTSNSVFVPAFLDSDGSTFKDNCVKKSNKHRDYAISGKNVCHYLVKEDKTSVENIHCSCQLVVQNER